jgi:hypothetical protein
VPALKLTTYEGGNLMHVAAVSGNRMH